MSNKTKRTKKTSKRRALPILVIVLALAALTLLFFSARKFLQDSVRSKVEIELGSTERPEASAFLTDNAPGFLNLSYVTDISTFDYSTIARFPVELKINNLISVTSELDIVDTVAPTGDGVEVFITIDEELTPDQLVTNLKDQSLVAISYAEKPEYGTPGDYEAILLLTDTSNNASTVKSMVHIRALGDPIVIEAGTEVPPASEFVVSESDDIRFVTDLSTLPLNVPGTYDVVIAIDGNEYTAPLTVVDTIAPVVTTQEQLLLPGDVLKPEDFILTAEDATALSYSFELAPDPETPGEQFVIVAVTDLGGNITTVTVKVVVSDGDPVKIEASREKLTAETIAEAMGLDTTGSTISLKETIIPTQIGYQIVTLTVDGEERIVVLNIQDTVAPTGEMKEVQGYVGYPMDPSEFVTNVEDETEVTFAFEKEPDWTFTDDFQFVTIIMTDAAGNKASVTSTLTLKEDDVAPSIYGAVDRYCFVDEAVSYYAEVFAEDNVDPNVTLTVDNSEVNIHEEGSYTITYTATDAAGNKTTESCVLTFVQQEVTDEELQELADEVMAEIITEDMDIQHQLYAVFCYVYDHMTYSDGSDLTNWKLEAKRGIIEGTGDCYTSFAVAHLLLSQLDVQILSVERVRQGDESDHYWHLVNDGTGWYHFDTNNTSETGYRCFMRTNDEILMHSEYFWRYDHSQYPETATKLYPLTPDGEER